METRTDPRPEKKDHVALAITSLIVGIFSLLGWLLPICGLPMSILGLVFGIISRKSSKRRMAIAGMVMSVIGLLLALTNCIIGAYLGYTGQLFQSGMSAEIEKQITERQVTRFRESYGDLIVKDTSMEVRGRGSVLPQDKANGIDQLVCYQVYVNYATRDGSCTGGDVMHGIAVRKSSGWDLDTYAQTDFGTWARHACGDFTMRPPIWCLTVSPTP